MNAMTDAELIALLQALWKRLDGAINASASAEARAEFRAVQDGLDQAIFQIARRDTTDQTKH